MKNILFFLSVFLFFSCKKNPPEIIKTDDYELIIPNNPKAVLILFPGMGGNAKNIKKQSKIPQKALDNDIAVLLLNHFNHHLFLYEQEKNQLQKIILNTLKEQHLENINIFLGGFSSGGNVALLIADRVNSKGVFIIDSPVDLADLYFTSEKKVQNNIDEELISEPKYLIRHLTKTIGNPTEDISSYENYSPYTSMTDFTYNLQFSQDIAIRLYTEPALEFYKQRFNKIEFEDLNASSIKKIHQSLQKLGYKNIEYIETKNKGFRANGNRSPHSWSIVDEKEIVHWILKNN